MAPLLSLAQQQAIKIISPNWTKASKIPGGTTNYDQLAQEVEEKELRSLVGVALLQDIQDSPTSANNVKLLDGDTFEDCDGNTIKFKGLRYVLAYMNYSKYIYETTISDSFTGMVSKNRTEATNLSNGSKKAIQNDAREIALQEWELTKGFLNDNKDTYPLWECGEGTQARKPYTPRFIGVKRTLN
jgi:hypothetical protein